MSRFESRICLLSITFCWSASYIFIKDLPETLSLYAYLTLTSGVGGIILAMIFHRRLARASIRDVKYGVILGCSSPATCCSRSLA